MMISSRFSLTGHHPANENGRVYAADMEDLRQRLDELIEIGRQILSRLAEL